MTLYRVLLLLFPAAFRARFADDMTATFRDRLTAARTAGVAGVARLWLRTIVDVTRHGLAERRRTAELKFRPATDTAVERTFRPPTGFGTVVQDVRYALRSLRRQPGFTAAALITLALGIGANTAIFSAVHAVLLRPLPYPDADRIVHLYATHRQYNFTRGVTNPFDLDYILRETTTIESLAATRGCQTTLIGAGEPARIGCVSVAPAFFDVMRTRPALGAPFTDKQTSAQERVVVLSHELWTSRFGQRPDIVGATITLDERPWSVIGVMPPGFDYPNDPGIWRPLYISPKERADLGSWFLGAVARLQPDAGIDAAQAELDGLAAQLATAYPKQRTNRGFRVVDLQEDRAFRSAGGLRLLQGVVALVLLIACANVANLLLAQGHTRAPELTIRAAIGASRARLIRQLTTESLVLAGAGAILGTLIAAVGLRALVALAPPLLLPNPDEIHVSLPALAFTAAIAAVTALLFGLAPAILAASSSVRTGSEARTVAGGLSLTRRQWLRAGLVTLEAALALVLLAGAGLLVRSFTLLIQQSPGIDPERVLTAQVTLPTAKYATADSRAIFWQSLLDTLSASPGVLRAGGSTALPFSLWEWQSDFVVQGREDVPNDGAGTRTITPDLLGTLGIPLLRGRGFDAADTAASERVAVVSEAFAKQHLAGLDPIGQRLTTRRDKPQWTTIVGVVGSTRHLNLAEAPRAEIYFPLSQAPAPSTLLVALKTAGDPGSVAPVLRTVVHDLDPSLPLINLTTMTELIDTKVAQPRFAMGLLGLFAGLAALLAATGVYGVMSFVVSQGRRELGIRFALGAQPGRVQRRVVAQGMVLVTLGAVIGLTAAFWATGLLRSSLFEITPRDPWTFAAASIGLLAIAAVACWIPAARVSQVNPVTVLKGE